MDPAERQALDLVVRRLRQKFPDIAAATIALEVADAYERYAAARVRTYLAILVEREVADRLRTYAARTHESVD